MQEKTLKMFSFQKFMQVETVFTGCWVAFPSFLEQDWPLLFRRANWAAPRTVDRHG